MCWHITFGFGYPLGCYISWGLGYSPWQKIAAGIIATEISDPARCWNCGELLVWQNIFMGRDMWGNKYFKCRMCQANVTQIREMWMRKQKPEA